MKTLLCVLVISLWNLQIAHAQQIRGAQADYNITGTGARAEGFGGAFIGVADDATAITWNPGGLTQLERAELSLVGRQVSDGLKYSSDFSSLKNSQTHLSLNSASLVLPFTLGDQKFVLAGAFQRQFDLNSDRTDAAGDVEVREAIKGGVDNVSLAIAYRLSRVISLGVTANYWFGKPESRYKETRVSALYGGDVSETYYAQTQKDDYFGYNFNSGLLLDLSSAKTRLKLGVAVRTPFTLYSETLYDGKSRFYTVWGGSPDQDYSFRYDITQNIRIPLMIGMGSSFQLGDNFTLSADYELRKFAKSKNKVLYAVRQEDGSGNVLIAADAEDYLLSESKKDLNQIRVGAEYLWINDFAVIPIRTGFRTLPTLKANSRFDGFETTRKQVSGTAVSFGLGFIVSRFALDFAYTLSGYTAKTVSSDASSKERVTRNYLTSSIIVYF